MRRKALRLILLAFLGLLVYSVFIEPAMLGFTTHEIKVKGLPSEFDGFKIVQLSDLHVNRWYRPEHVRGLVRKVNALHPDLVVLTGDYVSRNKADCAPAGRSLSGLKAKYGVHAVLGNHDYWTDPDAVTEALRASGIDVLFDEKRKIVIGGQTIWLVGTDDEWEGEPDYDKAFEGLTSRDVCLAIAHNPDAVLSMKGRPVSLLLAGHTHGGIINLPGSGPLLSISRLGRRCASGMFTANGVRTYVSRGLGTGPIAHIRFRCPPEVPIFVLRCGNGPTAPATPSPCPPCSRIQLGPRQGETRRDNHPVT